jgi:hypothetical protein
VSDGTAPATKKAQQGAQTRPEPGHAAISHIHKDDEHIASMKSLLGERGFDVRDSSINSERPNQAKDPDYIKSKILAPRIDWASTLVVLISPETRNSDWVDWEIEYAQQQDKRIVGVWMHGAAECDIPDALDKYADAVVDGTATGSRAQSAATSTIGSRATAPSAHHANSRGTGAEAHVRLYSYVVARDYGFAPNPFYGFCTLATCKPNIRKTAQVGDWVIGTGSKSKARDGQLVYAMRVSETMTFDEYWADPRFASKRPSLVGSLKQAFGDNIYHRTADGGWS